MGFRRLIYWLICFGFCSASSYKLNTLKCEICKAAVGEMEKAIAGVSASLLTDSGKCRLDEKGNKITEVIPLVESEGFLLEAMESACEQMQEYARGYDKKTKSLKVIRMKFGDRVNPQISNVDLISDSDLNESLKYYCEGLTDEHEETFLKVLKSRNSDAIKRLCVYEIGVCEKKRESETEL